MRFEQFEQAGFKPSLKFGFETESTVNMNGKDKVTILTKKGRYHVRKVINGECVCTVSFDMKKGRTQLDKFLKNIGKK